ncbi:MAG: hypothetical protein ACRYG8_37985 [Janthinobacterium lividum]
MSSNQTHQLPAAADPMVILSPEDDDTALAAGVQFARSLAGADPAGFMLALGEQEALIRSAIVKAGFSLEKAHLAGEAFEAGARSEWRRISASGLSTAWGTA